MWYSFPVLAVIEIHLRQIVVPTFELAEQLQKAIINGSDFGELALANSLRPYGANGGYLGHIAQSDLSPKVAKALTDLPTLKPSKIVASTKGYHIFQKIPVIDISILYID